MNKVKNKIIKKRPSKVNNKPIEKKNITKEQIKTPVDQTLIFGKIARDILTNEEGIIIEKKISLTDIDKYKLLLKNKKYSNYISKSRLIMVDGNISKDILDSKEFNKGNEIYKSLKIKPGFKVKDRITNFTGVVESVIIPLEGTYKISIIEKFNKGKISSNEDVELRVLDINRVKIINRKYKKLKK